MHLLPGMVYIGQMKPAHATGLCVQVRNTYEAMSRAAADLVCRELGRRPNLLLCASAGGTPTRAYELLAHRFASNPRLFHRMRVLQIDEWLGLKLHHPATCEADLRAKLLKPLGITADRFMGPRTNAANPDAECRRLARWLANHGPIDICLLGLGTNGHVAMNEPADALVPEPHVARLADSSRNHPLLKDVVRKPRHGLTLGMGDILRSRKILLLVNGEAKRAAVSMLLQSPVTTRFPASFLQLHSEATLLCDRDAAPDLPGPR